jgi:hypothetical protein
MPDEAGQAEHRRRRATLLIHVGRGGYWFADVSLRQRATTLVGLSASILGTLECFVAPSPTDPALR